MGAAALAVAAAAVALIVTNHDRAPGDGLPDAVAPSVSVPVYTTEPEPEATPAPTQPGPPERVTFVGDSIMVAAESQLYNYMPDCVVDAKEGRQLVEAMDILRRLESEGQLYETVVIGLGSNSPFPIEDGEEVLDFLGEDRTVYWVTCYGRYLDWQDEVNELIHTLDEEYDNLYVLDWSSVAPENPAGYVQTTAYISPPTARWATPASWPPAWDTSSRTRRRAQNNAQCPPHYAAGTVNMTRASGCAHFTKTKYSMTSTSN